MKRSILFLLSIHFTIILSSQVLKKDESVEVNLSLSDSVKANWKHATIVDVDSVGKKYTVKLPDGNRTSIPSTSPEFWIRPFVDKQYINKYGPGARIPYQKRANALKSIKCNGSEAAVKRNIVSQMANHFKDYGYISVEFTSFKAQHGYDDPKFKGQQIYPYKIEMLVHLKRVLIFAGNEYTEYQTWEYDRVYEYATRAGRACEFYALSTSDAELVSKAWY